MRARGHTLIELVVTIAVAAVVVSMMAMFIAGPVRAYADQRRRAELVDEADAALRMIARDLRGALPNSVRIANDSGRIALEFIATVDGARYRDGALGDPALDLDLAQPDAEFTTASPFTHVALPFDSISHYLAIYNVGVPGADAYELANVISPPGTRLRIEATATAGSARVRLSPAVQYTWASPGKRVYLASGPVTYLCDPASGRLDRYAGYPLAPAQQTTAAALLLAGAAPGRVAGDLAGCAIDYAAGTPERAALVTLLLRLERDGERIELLHQVHLPNAP